MKNELNLLNKDLAKYYNLLSIEDEADYCGLSLAEEQEYVEMCEDYCGIKVVGVIRIKDGYQDSSWECDGSFYGDDGKIYYGYGNPMADYRFVQHDAQYALENVVEEN